MDCNCCKINIFIVEWDFGTTFAIIPSVHYSLTIPIKGEKTMTNTKAEKRDQLAYVALYYAIHGEDERSEKIRLALRQLNNTAAQPNRVESVTA